MIISSGVICGGVGRLSGMLDSYIGIVQTDNS